MKIFKGKYCERQAENIVVQFLEDNGLETELKRVTTQEDINGCDIKSSEGIRFQVKHQKAAIKTGNFSFELQEKNLTTGEVRPGNHWHDFDWYVISPDCVNFYVIDPYQIDKLLEDTPKSEWPKGARVAWNKHSTVRQSAREWTGGERWTAQNLLVPIEWLVEQENTCRYRVKVS